MSDVVVTFSASDDEKAARTVMVLVEAENEADAIANVETVGDLLLTLDSPKLVDEGLYAFLGKAD